MAGSICLQAGKALNLTWIGSFNRLHDVSLWRERTWFQLYLHQSNNLLDWEPVGTVLDVKAGSKISPRGSLKFGMNFECASFFSIGTNDYLTLGVEENQDSTRHNCRYALWFCGNLILDNGKPKFVIKSHGLLDYGISYAPHIFRDSEDRLIRLGWADEMAKSHIVTRQGWAGCLAYPRGLYEISRPICKVPKDDDIWTMDSTSGRMTTLGIRPAPQITSLRQDLTPSDLRSLTAMRSNSFALEATFLNFSDTKYSNSMSENLPVLQKLPRLSSTSVTVV